MALAFCIGCGCDDLHACVDDDDEPCSWLTVDYPAGRGVCSCCEAHLARWNAGDRSMVMLVAKITKEGEVDPYYFEKNAFGIFPSFLDVGAGDKFSVEWLDMSVDEFEALPQFEHIRLAQRWLSEVLAASAEGRGGEVLAHQAEADRLAAEVVKLGFTVGELVDPSELPEGYVHA